MSPQRYMHCFEAPGCQKFVRYSKYYVIKVDVIRIQFSYGIIGFMQGPWNFFVITSLFVICIDVIASFDCT